MDRSTFGTGFMERQRFVLQQQERCVVARTDLADATAQLSAARFKTDYLTRRVDEARSALADYENRLDAAIDAFAVFVYRSFLDIVALSELIPARSSPNDDTASLSPTSDKNGNGVGEREPSPSTNRTNA